VGLCEYGNELLRFSKAALLAQFPDRIDKLDNKINIVVLILQLIFGM
jgi:hypothetical protein